MSELGHEIIFFSLPHIQVGNIFNQFARKIMWNKIQCDVDPDIIIDLLLQANDVEANPGPSTKMENLEKTISELNKELGLLRRLVEHQSLQIQNLSRCQQRTKVEESISRLNEVVFDLKEKQDVQATMMKRVRADLAAFGQEFNSIKKLNQNQRNQLKVFASQQYENSSAPSNDQGKNILNLVEEKFSEVGALKNSFKTQIMAVRQNTDALATQFNDQSNDNKLRFRNIEASLTQVAQEAMKVKEGMNQQEGQITEISKNLSEFKHLTLIDQEKCRQIHEQKLSKLNDVKNQVEEMPEQLHILAAQLDKHRKHMDDELSQCQEEFKSAHFKLLESMRGLSGKYDQELSILGKQMKILLHSETAKSQKFIVNLSERMDELDGMYDDIQDRVFEIDKNRKNNLVFYGVKGDDNDNDECEKLIRSILANNFLVTREIPMTKVLRLWNGPSFRGVKPIQVCFQLFKDKEDLLRKSNAMLRGTNIYVTEDFSRKVRKHREELIKFAREIRTKDPSCRCLLQYDRLCVENTTYLYNDIKGKVEKVRMKAATPSGVETSVQTTSRRLDAKLPIVDFAIENAISQGCQTMSSTFPTPRQSNNHPRDALGIGDGVSSDGDSDTPIYFAGLREIL